MQRHQAWRPPSEESVIERVRPRWLLASVAGLAAGLAAAGLYAWLSADFDYQDHFLLIGVGAAVGVVVPRIVRVDSLVTAGLCLAIAGVCVAVAIYLDQAVASWGDLSSALSHFSYADLRFQFSTYFGHPSTILWVGVALFAAIVLGWGLRRWRADAATNREINARWGQGGDRPRA
jgi:hypothetical protein